MAGQLESLTKLLKQYKVNLSAVAANRILLKAGILEERERPSSRDPSKTKKFKILTAAGLDYGDNVQNDLSPETTPKYYADKFQALLDDHLQRFD